MNKKVWSEEEDLLFYDVVYKKIDDLKRFNSVNLKNQIFLDMCSELKLQIERENVAFLYRLEHINFFKMHPSFKKNRNSEKIYFTKNEDFCYKTFLIDKLNDFYKEKIIKNKENIIIFFKKSNKNIKHLIKEISDFFSLNYTQVVYLLKENDLIKLDDNNEFICSYEKPEINNKNKLNDIRKKISKINNTNNIEMGTIIFTNDGTGSGKTYGVINEFLSGIDENKKIKSKDFRNLIFTSIQKNQLEIDGSLMKKANSLKIPVLMLRSQEDIRDIKTPNLVKGKVINRETFERWMSSYNVFDKNVLNKDFVKIFNSFISLVKNVFYKEDEIQLLKSKNYADIEELEVLLKKQKNALFDKIKELCIYIIKNEKLDKIIKNKALSDELNNIEDLIYEIIEFAAPLEISKYRPCIIICTADKFKKHTIYSHDNIKAECSKNTVIEDIISSKISFEKKEGTESISDHISSDKQILKNFLENFYFKMDYESWFIKNNISFTVVFDEEHDNYKKYLERESFEVVLENSINIAHTFSSLYRLHKNVVFAKKNNMLNGVEETKNEYLSNIQKYMDENCKFSNGRIVFHEFLEGFSDNFGAMMIDGGNLEYVVNICKSVFSLSNQKFFNDDELKKIKILPMSSNCEILFSDDIEKHKELVSMHDVLQILMSILYVSKDVQDETFIYDLNSLVNDGDSQNSSLHNFIRKAKENNKIISSIFESAINKDLVNKDINDVYSYFIPKIFFSIKPVLAKKVTNENKNKIRCIFEMGIVKELPEVSIIRMVYGTKNAVLGLSATRGFNGVYGGYYSHRMLERFSSSNGMLDYEVKRRTKDKDSEILKSFINERKKIRERISINVVKNTKTMNSIILTGSENIEELVNENILDADNSLLKVIKGNSNYEELSFFRKNEFENIVNFIDNSIFRKENSIILSLTNNFSKIISDYNFFKIKYGNRFIPVDGLTEADNHKIFEFKNREGFKTRIICFDAGLGKNNNLDGFLEVKENENVIIVSSYQSAGTGLNFVINDIENNISKDFDSLYLVNSPYYTSVNNKENGFNNEFNYLLLLKKESEKPGSKILNFDYNLYSPENMNHLIFENETELLKSVIQATGRIERRDNNQFSNIYIYEDLFIRIASYYNNFYKMNKDDILLDSLSMLNQQMLKSSIYYLNKQKFKTNVDRINFENKTKLQNIITKDFFENNFKKLLNIFRNSDNPDINIAKFNECIRSINIIQDPEKYIKDLENSLNKIKDISERERQKILRAIRNFYILNEDENVRVCISQDGEYYTDFENSYRFLNFETFVPTLNNVAKDSDVDTAIKKLEKSMNSIKIDNLNKFIPCPYLFFLIRGNIGEFIFSEYLKIMDIKSLSVQDLIDKEIHSIYELFDYYFLNEKDLICLDVKLWNNKNKAKISKELLSKLSNKGLFIEKTTGKELNKKFVYVNTSPNRNKESINELTSNAKMDSVFYNLIITKSQNVSKKVNKIKKNEYGEETQVKSSKITIEECLSLEDKLIKIIKGSK